MKNALLLGLAAGIGAAMVVGRRKPEDAAVGAMTWWSSAAIPPTWPSPTPIPYGPMWWPRRAWWPWRRRMRWRPRRWWWPR